MNNNSTQITNGIFLLNPEINQQQILDAMSACLCKAEALASTAAAIDFEAYMPETISNYLWALGDIIREARWLYEKAHII